MSTGHSALISLLICLSLVAKNGHRQGAITHHNSIIYLPLRIDDSRRTLDGLFNREVILSEEALPHCVESGMLADDLHGELAEDEILSG